MTDTVVVLIRSLAAYITLFILARMMGKQVIAQVTFFEFVVGIMIGDIAATMAMDINSVSFAEGLVAMLVMAGVTVMLSALQLKSPRLRRILEGSPTVLIQNGKILTENLLKERFTIQDLKSQLRLQQIFSIDQVDTAILEPNGHVSVKPKTPQWDITGHGKKLVVSLLQAEAALACLADDASQSNDKYRKLSQAVTALRERIVDCLYESPRI